MQYTIIDVREPNEHAAGHVEGSVNIPLSRLEDSGELTDIPKDAPLIVHCESGGRSDAAIKTLRCLGYTNVTNGINKEQVEADYLT